MRDEVDPAVLAFTGSRTRALTLAVLANAEEPFTGYRVAKIAGLNPSKVYRELLRASKAGLIRRDRTGNGYIIADPDVRTFLRRRLRIRWDDEWDKARAGWDDETPGLLSTALTAIRGRVRENPNYLRPRGWKPPASAESWAGELRRPPEKDAGIRRAGRRTSRREDWNR